MENVQTVRSGDWQAIEASTKLVLVDFWSEWCAPCRMLAPVFEKLAEKFGGEFGFAKVNVDEAPDVTNKFGIRSIPTLLLLKQGKVVEQIVGARSYNELATMLENHHSAPVKVD
jgi:thioredoxin